MELPTWSTLINTFIDFIWFYYEWNLWEINKDVAMVRKSDNDNMLYFDNFYLDYSSKYYLMVYVLHLWLIIPFARIETIHISTLPYTKVSLYWKWLKAMRDVPHLYSSFISLFVQLWYKYERLYYTRLDITRDYSRLWFNIKCKLRTKKTFTVYWHSWLETKYFWSPKSSVYIRYYNKKKELADKWRLDLYPEYQSITEVMRYEIQIKNKAIPLHINQDYSTILWLKKLALWEDQTKSLKYVSKSTKQSNKRAKQLFQSFLYSLSSRYYLQDVKQDLHLIYKNWQHEQLK